MEIKREETIDTSEYKYTLLIGEDVYFAQSIWSLVMEVLAVAINRRWVY